MVKCEVSVDSKADNVVHSNMADQFLIISTPNNVTIHHPRLAMRGT